MLKCFNAFMLKCFNEKGIIITYVLIFGTAFLIMLAGLLSFILLQLRVSAQKVAWNQAFQIAEAGINYYHWCLNNEIETKCQTEKDYYDPAGNLLGKFSLKIDLTVFCGQTIQRKVVSSGWTNKYPQIKRKISTFYARTSVGKYSYILNDNVWVGSDHEIRGPYHSNGGIRFDGENQSIVASVRDKWICTHSFGCCRRVYFGSPYFRYGYDCSQNCPSASGCEVRSTGTRLVGEVPIKDECFCPGIFTTTQNPNDDLFSFPIPPFDFGQITIDLAQIKRAAQAGGIYLPPSKQINPHGKGYHLIFKNDGKLEVRIITALSPTRAYSIEEGWHDNYFTITSEYLYKTYTIPPTCPVIFVEDNLWPGGVIKGKVTLASANLIDPVLDTDVILQKNIGYTTLGGADSLTLIGERNVLIGPDSPNVMELRGIFLAQKGRFSRNHYPGNFREKLEIYGSIISNGRVGTKWISGSQVISGYLKRESYFDSVLIYNPPPFTSFIDPEFKIIKWEEL